MINLDWKRLKIVNQLLRLLAWNGLGCCIRKHTKPSSQVAKTDCVISKISILFENWLNSKFQISGHGRIQDLRADRRRRESDAVARAARHLARRGNAREGTRMKMKRGRWENPGVFCRVFLEQGRFEAKFQSLWNLTLLYRSEEISYYFFALCSRGLECEWSCVNKCLLWTRDCVRIKIDWF